MRTRRLRPASPSTSVLARSAAPSGTVPLTIPRYNLIFIGEVEWCTTVTLLPTEKIAGRARQTVVRQASINPFNTWGKADPFGLGGWVVRRRRRHWRLEMEAKTNYPIQSGMTPTAGGIVFFGDMGGNFYVLDTANGRKLWGQKIGGAIGGGVITYTANGAQKVAVATGFTSHPWPTEVVTGKIIILGLGDVPVSQRQAAMAADWR